MSKADEYKAKMLEKERKRKEEAERKKRETEQGGNPEMPVTAEERNAREELLQGDEFTFTFKPLKMTLADPTQTFAMRKNLDELIGCFFEPEVKKAMMADQKKKGPGWKSHLVNELVKQYYKQQGKF